MKCQNLSFLGFFFAAMFAFAFGCKTPDQLNGSDTKSIATDADIKVALDILESVSSIGDCNWTIAASPSRQQPTILRLKFAHLKDSASQLETTFFNDSGPISFVDVKYSELGLGQPYALVLEKVETSAAPANKYRLTYEIKEKRPVSVSLEIMNGSNSNLIKNISCTQKPGSK
ncbi:MAG: hypothetical protein NTV34_06735 [Proteobacteria bacterium]|nr:hypothetical protein [Pseudomonadota bacterium]